MRRSIALALALAACVQQPAKQLEINPGSIEVLPPAPLQPSPLPTVGGIVDEVAAGEVPAPPPLQATATLTVLPTGTSAVSQVREISVVFDVLGAGPSVVAVEFVSPSGVPYHREEAPLDGSPFVTRHLTFTLPVAATSIDSNRITGTWAARLMVDGRALATTDFLLTP